VVPELRDRTRQPPSSPFPRPGEPRHALSVRIHRASPPERRVLLVRDRTGARGWHPCVSPDVCRYHPDADLTHPDAGATP